jgi:hypothetical protein
LTDEWPPDCGLEPDAAPLVCDLSHVVRRYTPHRVALRLDPRLAHLHEDAEIDRVRHVLRGFEIADLLQLAQDCQPSSFGMIGPAAGAEAIGAAHIFGRIRRIVLTDRDPLLLAEAASNIRRHVPREIRVVCDEGHIYAPLAATAERVDLLYANLADIPFTAAAEAVIEYMAYCPSVLRTAHDALLNACELGVAYCFLSAAPAALTARGAALVLLGGRFPLAVFHRLADAAGMRIVEVQAWLQRQADARHVLAGFAAAETGAQAFDFYDFDTAQALLPRRAGPHGDALKRLLAPCRLSAGAALAAFHAGRAIGYTAHLLLATPFRNAPAE